MGSCQGYNESTIQNYQKNPIQASRGLLHHLRQSGNWYEQQQQQQHDRSFKLINYPLNFFVTGTSSKRRQDEVARLNAEFKSMIKPNLSIDGILCFLIETENYRMLSAQHYTWRESPIRSGRVCDRKELTMVISLIY